MLLLREALLIPAADAAAAGDPEPSPVPRAFLIDSTTNT
jgi:hypothetical protein